MQNNVQTLRKKLNISQCELAKKCGFTTKSGTLNNGNIARIERGGSPRLHTARAIYNVFKSNGLCDNFEDVFPMTES